MRILKGWTSEEQKELEEAKDNGFTSAIVLINGIVKSHDDCIALTRKFLSESADEDNQLVKDIVDFYTDKAEFKEQKYYIQLPKTAFAYLVQADYGIELVRYLKSGYKEEFTAQEIIAIDPRYLAFAVPVEAK